MYPYKSKFKMTSPRANRVLFGKTEFHKGIDLVGEDKNIYSVSGGTVEYAGWENAKNKSQGFGLYVRVRLDDGRRIYYAHLQSISVSVGKRINVGDKIGIEGATGNVTGRHLHIELRGVGNSKESQDICAFLGIENKVGTYFPKEMSTEEFVGVLASHGIVTDSAGMIAEIEKNPNGRLFHLAKKTALYLAKKV